jgi:hypothetical protein
MNTDVVSIVLLSTLAGLGTGLRGLVVLARALLDTVRLLAIASGVPKPEGLKHVLQVTYFQKGGITEDEKQRVYG